MAWEIRVKEGLRLLCSSILFQEKWLEHGVVLAHQEEDARFNLGFTAWDDAKRVVLRRSKLTAAMGLSSHALVCGAQVHGCHVAWVEPSQKERGAFALETALPETDGLATATSELMLMTFHADCVPILLADPVHRAVAAIHAGWKGTANRIVLRGIEVLMEHVGANPRDIKAAIGPAAGACCYEVGPEIEEPMQSTLKLTKTPFERRINLPEINRRLLLTAGLRSEAIDAGPPCTICGGEDFFSYRRQGAAAGRMGSWIVRKV